MKPLCNILRKSWILLQKGFHIIVTCKSFWPQTLVRIIPCKLLCCWALTRIFWKIFIFLSFKELCIFDTVLFCVKIAIWRRDILHIKSCSTLIQNKWCKSAKKRDLNNQDFVDHQMFFLTKYQLSVFYVYFLLRKWTSYWSINKNNFS